MPELFADLHCHPTLYGFNRLRNRPALERDAARFHPWAPQPRSLRDRLRGSHAATYTQCTFAQLVAGRLRLAFVSLTPIEKGFMVFEDAQRRGSFGAALGRLLRGQTLLSLGRHLRAHLASRGRPGPGALDEAIFELAAPLRATGPLRLALQKVYLRYGWARLRYLASDDYDYWEELWQELRFLRAKDGATESGEVDEVVDGRARARRVEGSYHLIRDAEQLRDLIEGDASQVAAILTVEGAHVFSIGKDQEPLPLSTMVARIGELRRLPEALLFITLAHHFDNGICGHAHSIPDKGKAVLTQARRLGEGFERRDELGLTVVRELLDLDASLGDRGERRILIDIKHMSPRTRCEYYAEVLEPYLARWEQQDPATQVRFPKIPVIGSHVAYSGVATLEELIAAAAQEDDDHHVGPYYAWGLNLSDEDIRMTHRTEGLLGLIFDRRVAGVRDGAVLDREGWARVVVQQLFGVVDVIFGDDTLPFAERLRAWDCLCIGSDYDGVVNPLTAFPTVLEYESLASTLRPLLAAHATTRGIAELGVDELLEKLCWKNAYTFALRHLPRAQP